MGRTKKVAYTVVDLSEKSVPEIVMCDSEADLHKILGHRDLSSCHVFAGAALTVEKNVTFSLNAKKKAGRPAGTGKKRGRPPGTGKKPGRPKKEAAAATAAPAAAPKKRGRPPKAKAEATVSNILTEVLF